MSRAPALLEQHPYLGDTLPFVPLATAPTPVARMSRLGARIGAASLWVKRDDRLSRAWGGSKVRKLEWVLGAARRADARSLLTVGVEGSHHVLATTLLGRAAGFEVEALTFPGPVTDRSARAWSATLRGGLHAHRLPHASLVPAAIAAHRLRTRTSRDARRYWIPGGGAGAVGTLGAVDAALELAAQIEADELPQPHTIWVASGTGGTQAGLIAGLRLAGLDCRVVGVRVVPRIVCNRTSILRQARGALRLLRAAGLETSTARLARADVHLEHAAFGPGYGRPTPASVEAVALAADLERLELEPVYTGKALSALLSAALDDEAVRDRPALFWVTCGPPGAPESG